MFLQNKQYVLMNEADDGSGKGGSGSDSGNSNSGAGGDKDNAASSTQQIELLTKSVGLLAQGLQKMEANQASLVEALAKITDTSKKDVKAGIEDMFGKDVDLEQLSRQDFAAYISNAIKDQVVAETKKMTEAVDGRVNDLASKFESKNAGEQISALANVKPDFWEWSAEIKTLLKDNPTLSVKRAYTIARDEDSAKANKMDEKYKKQEDDDGQFIGLTPTSSLASKGTKSKMSPSEAANAAFDTVMDKLGGRINNGDMKLA